MKKLRFLVVASAILMLMVITAYAATANFSGTLPANQGDTEISTVARLNDTTTMKYFSITITSLQSGYSSVRAWTEGIYGNNFSDPYIEAKLNIKKDIFYSAVPTKGHNVVLNLDNPVYTSNQVSVAGNWTPN